MTNNRVGVSKMPNHRSILELASRANTSLDAEVTSFHLAIANEFQDIVLEPAEFVRRWYTVVIANLSADLIDDMVNRFTNYARIFFAHKNPYFAERLKQEYAKLIASEEKPVAPWYPSAAQVAQLRKSEVVDQPPVLETPKTVAELRQDRAEYRDQQKDADSTSSGESLVEPAQVIELIAEANETPVLKPKRKLPANFEDLKINELRALAKRWNLDTSNLRSKDDYRDALRAMVDNES